MLQPQVTSLTIDDLKFNVESAHFGISTVHDDRGMPMMGSQQCSISFTVNIHDTQNMPFSRLKALFDLANVVTRAKVKTIKIEFWQDEKQQDAICTYTFQGWIRTL